MSNEWPKSNIEKEEPLNKSEAHDTANMMKAELAGDRGLSYFRELERTRTAKEYDDALAVVEEIKQMAEKEPLTQKVLAEIARLSIKSGFGVLYVIGEIAAAIASEAASAVGQGDKVPLFVGAKISLYGDKLIKEIDSASVKLKILKADGKEFGKIGNIHEFSKEWDKENLEKK